MRQSNFWSHHPSLKEYPALLAALNTDTLTGLSAKENYTEIIGMWNHEGDLFSASAASFFEEKPAAILGMELYDLNTGLLMQTEYLDGQDLYTLEGLSCFTGATKKETTRSFRQEAHFMWLEPSGVVQTAERVLDIDLLPVDAIVDSTVVTAPRAKNHKRTIVLYGREPYTGEFEDYKYKDNKKTADGKVKALLPVHGVVTFNSEYVIEKVLMDGEHAPKLQLIFSTGEEPVCYKRDMSEAFSIDGQELHFDFNEDWNTEIDVHQFNVSTVLNFYLTFKVSVFFEKIPYTVSIVVTSLNNLPDADTPTTVLIEPISIRWGCLAKDTMVRMADGTRRPIQDICIGEQVMTQTGSACVINIYSGQEEMLCCLETESGKKLMATADHPIQTAQGPKRMDILRGDDLILSEDSQLEPLNALYSVEYNDKVYCLSLEGDETHYISANGLMAGDFNEQNTLTQEPQKTTWDEDARKLQQEFQSLVAKLKTEK